MTSSFTTNKAIEKPASGDYSGAWATPMNANFDIVDRAMAGSQSYSMSNLDVLATQTELVAARIKVTGTLTANVALKIPLGISGKWIVTNSTSGAFVLTVKQATSDTGVPIPQGKSALVYSDGVNSIYGVDLTATDLSGYLQRANNLADLASASAARGNLGLGNSATHDIGTGSGQVAAGDDSRFSTLANRDTTASTTLSSSDAGLIVWNTTGGVIVPTGLVSNGVFTVANESGSAITITQGSGLTMYLQGTTTSGNRSLAARGMATIIIRNGTTAYITGDVT